MGRQDFFLKWRYSVEIDDDVHNACIMTQLYRKIRILLTYIDVFIYKRCSSVMTKLNMLLLQVYFFAAAKF